MPEASSAKVRDTSSFYATGATSVFAARVDQRFSYCLYVPGRRDGDPERYPLVVIQHGTGRTAGQYRDAMAGFCEEQRCVVLAPLFPAGIIDQDDLHNFKFIAYRDIRFDHVLLGIVDEVAEKFPVDGTTFMLHGFSGGGQFTHRFLYLHPDRLAAASIGAPGRLTLLDDSLPWWLGTGGFAEEFGTEIDLDAIRRVPVQMVVGENDVETWEINNPGESNWMDGVEKTGSTRVERLRTLRDNFEAHGITVRFDLIPDMAHNGTLALPRVGEFFADVMGEMRAGKGSGR